MFVKLGIINDNILKGFLPFKFFFIVNSSAQHGEAEKENHTRMFFIISHWFDRVRFSPPEIGY